MEPIMPKNFDTWIPACNGTEQPFTTRNGMRVLYCWNPGRRQHRYLTLDTEAALKKAAKVIAKPTDPVDQIVKKFDKLSADEKASALQQFKDILENQAAETTEEDEEEDTAVAA